MSEQVQYSVRRRTVVTIAVIRILSPCRTSNLQRGRDNPMLNRQLHRTRNMEIAGGVCLNPDTSSFNETQSRFGAWIRFDGTNFSGIAGTVQTAGNHLFPAPIRNWVNCATVTRQMFPLSRCLRWCLSQVQACLHGAVGDAPSPHQIRGRILRVLPLQPGPLLQSLR